MKKILMPLVTVSLLGVAVLALSAGPWSGFYVGANGGYGWGDPSSANDNTLLPFPSISGGLAGGQVGFDWQFAQVFVLGLGYEMDWSNLSGSASDVISIGNQSLGLSASENITYFGDLLPRFGVLLGGNFLAYADGGLDFAHVTGNTSVSIDSASYPYGSFAQTAYGWAVGGGFEWLFMPQWSLGAMYLYNQLNNIDETSNAGTSTVAINSYNVVQASINYRF